MEQEIAEWPQWCLEMLRVTVRGSTRRAHDDGGVGRVGEAQRTGNFMLRTKYILQRVERTQLGKRNDVLYWASVRFGEMVGEGVLNRVAAEKCLESACRVNRLWFDGPEKVKATIMNGIERGMHQGHQGLGVLPLTAPTAKG
jgi:hypothetical protein